MTCDILEKWDRAKFLDNKGDPTVIGIVVETETFEGQRSYKILVESREDDVNIVWEQGNPFGLVQFWDYEAWECLGRVSVDEMLIHDQEMIREYAKAHKKKIETELDPSDEELCLAKKKQTLKKQIKEASDDELDRLIDSL